MNSHQRRKYKRELKRSPKADLMYENVSNDFLDNVDNCWTWGEEVK